jgi:osmotically-inducible protein OsmY
MKAHHFAALAFAASLGLAAQPVRTDRDARIVTAARQSYNFRVYLKADDIQVSSRDGAVTLSGSAANRYHKALAEETVQGLPEVRSVNNELLVRVEEAGSGDAWLVTKAKLALAYHRNIDASATQMTASDGVVTLSGRVASAAQKALTGNIVENVDGVKEVKNELQVLPPAGKHKTLAEKIDDASVTAQVKAVLLGHRGTHMLSTRVKTDLGVVHIRGEARDAAEKELVTRLVADVRGVRRIDNRMTIAHQGH